MWLLISIASAIVFGLAGWWMKVSQMKGGSHQILLLALYTVGTLGFGIHTMLEGAIDQLFHIEIWVAGFIIGIGSSLGNLYFMKALDLGPASLTSPLTNMNIVLVVLMGTFIYGEVLGAMQLVSIMLLLFATVLISQKKEAKSIASNWWYSFVALAIVLFAVRNGGLKVIEQLHYSSAAVLFVAYLISILFFLAPLRSSKNVTREAVVIGWKYGAITGLLSYGGLQLYAVALQHGPSNLVAPIFATNGLIVTILSIAIYKEVLSRIQWIAFAALLLGLICIRIAL